MVNHYLLAYNRKFKTREKISPEAIEKFQTYPFPGNVRELKNIVKKGVVRSESNYLDSYLNNGFRLKKHNLMTTEDSGSIDLRANMIAYEKAILLQALEGNTTTREIAKKLQIDHSTVVRKLKNTIYLPFGVTEQVQVIMPYRLQAVDSSRLTS